MQRPQSPFPGFDRLSQKKACGASEEEPISPIPRGCRAVNTGGGRWLREGGSSRIVFSASRDKRPTAKSSAAPFCWFAPTMLIEYHCAPHPIPSVLAHTHAHVPPPSFWHQLQGLFFPAAHGSVRLISPVSSPAGTEGGGVGDDGSGEDELGPSGGRLGRLHT